MAALIQRCYFYGGRGERLGGCAHQGRATLKDAISSLAALVRERSERNRWRITAVMYGSLHRGSPVSVGLGAGTADEGPAAAGT